MFHAYRPGYTYIKVLVTDIIVLGGEDSRDLALIKVMPMLLEKPVNQLRRLSRVLFIALSEDRAFTVCHFLSF